MFHEIGQEFIKQQDSLPKKRWFRDADAECDLFLWQNDKKELRHFQFRYHDALIEWDPQHGLRTGHVDSVSGSFIHYQSIFFRLHHDLDQQIIRGVKDLLDHKNDDLLAEMGSIQEVLHEIAGRINK
jgi:hypothetical protein